MQHFSQLMLLVLLLMEKVTLYSMYLILPREVFQADRDYTFFSQWDDGEGGLYNGGSSGGPNTNIFSGALGPDTTANCSGFGVTFGKDGSLRRYSNDPATTDAFNYAPFNYAQLPQTRNQVSVKGHYEISDTKRVYGSAYFTSSNVPSQLAPTPIFQSGSVFTIDGNPFLPAATKLYYQKLLVTVWIVMLMVSMILVLHS